MPFAEWCWHFRNISNSIFQMTISSTYISAFPIQYAKLVVFWPTLDMNIDLTVENHQDSDVSAFFAICNDIAAGTRQGVLGRSLSSHKSSMHYYNGHYNDCYIINLTFNLHKCCTGIWINTILDMHYTQGCRCPTCVRELQAVVCLLSGGRGDDC